MMMQFNIGRKKRDYSERSVLRFARDQGVAQGIIVGRMLLERMMEYNALNNLKEKYEIVV